MGEKGGGDHFELRDWKRGAKPGFSESRGPIWGGAAILSHEGKRELNNSSGEKTKVRQLHHGWCRMAAARWRRFKQALHRFGNATHLQEEGVDLSPQYENQRKYSFPILTLVRKRTPTRSLLCRIQRNVKEKGNTSDASRQWRGGTAPTIDLPPRERKVIWGKKGKSNLHYKRFRFVAVLGGKDACCNRISPKGEKKKKKSPSPTRNKTDIFCRKGRIMKMRNSAYGHRSRKRGGIVRRSSIPRQRGDASASLPFRDLIKGGGKRKEEL